MPATKYYHVKPKVRVRLSYGQVRADDLSMVRTKSIASATAGGQIMDLAFVESQTRPIATAQPTMSLAWLKLVFLAILGVGVYAGGVVLYQSADQIKKDTVETVTKGVAKIETAAQAIALNNLPEARNNLIAAENLFATAQRDVLSLGQTNLYMSGLNGDKFKIIAGQKLIDAGLNLTQSGQLLIATAEPAMQYFNNSTVEQGNTQAQDFLPQVVQILSASARNLDKALAKATKADDLLQSIDAEALGADYASSLALAQTKASALASAVAMLDVLAKQLPRALGSPNPRSYLILNQNDTELRPTGGFMGSYAIAKLQRGKLTDFFVDDTYRIDGQLAQSQGGEKVIPNANFDPDFPASAKYIANLYEQAGGGTPDGVIAINTQVMTAIMQVIGNIELPERKLTITPENFAQVVYGEIQKVEKTANPKAILSEISPILMQKIMSLSRDDLNKLTPLLAEQISKKNIMIYSRNAELQNVLSTLSWSGELRETAPKQDFLMVVRANMGAMKSSYNIQDAITHQVVVNTNGEISERLTLNYAHIGTGSLPDGPNKDYVRVYLPKGTLVKNLIGYDTTEKVVTESVHNKASFGFYVTTNPGETKTITIDYRLPFTLDTTKGESYSVYFQKQAGTLNTILNSTLKTPSSSLTSANTSKEIFRGELLRDIAI